MDYFKEITTLILGFEEKNNISIYMTICGDGSMAIVEFWREEYLFTTSDFELLKEFLTSTKYVLDENGLCNNPVEIELTSPNVVLHIKEQKEINDSQIIDKEVVVKYLNNITEESIVSIRKMFQKRYDDIKNKKNG